MDYSNLIKTFQTSPSNRVETWAREPTTGEFPALASDISSKKKAVVEGGKKKNGNGSKGGNGKDVAVKVEDNSAPKSLASSSSTPVSGKGRKPSWSAVVEKGVGSEDNESTQKTAAAHSKATSLETKPCSKKATSSKTKGRNCISKLSSEELKAYVSPFSSTHPH